MAGSGGAWKVAYADFVTAMMAFFLVMWIVAQNKPAKEAIAGYFRDPTGKRMGTRGAGSAARSAVKRPDAPPVDPRKTGDDPQGAKNGYQGRPPTIIKSRLPSSLHVGRSIAFAGNSTELDETARLQLTEAAPALRGKSNRIEIRAHMSRVADATAVDVWQICYRRCVATMQFLVEQGVEPDRLRLSLAGANDPIAPPAAVDWAEQNSRIEVFLTNEFVSRRSEGAPEISAAGGGTPERAAPH